MSERNEVVENLIKAIKKNLDWKEDKINIDRSHRWSIKLLANYLYKHRKKIGLYTKKDLGIKKDKYSRVCDNCGDEFFNCGKDIIEDGKVVNICPNCINRNMKYWHLAKPQKPIKEIKKP